MEKKYLAQIIATDNEGLQMISACTQVQSESVRYKISCI